MRNNDASDVEKAIGRGLRDSDKTSDGHGDRGKTSSPRVANETEREHPHLEQGQSQGQTGYSNIEEAQEQWTEVSGRTKGGTQKSTDKRSHSNGVGTRSGGAYHSSDKNGIYGNRNGNIFGQDAARGPNSTTNSTPADGMEHYRVNVGYVDVHFMCGNGKGLLRAGLSNSLLRIAPSIKMFAFSLYGAKTTTFVFRQMYPTLRKEY
jgi:hypothetical protein